MEKKKEKIKVEKEKEEKKRMDDIKLNSDEGLSIIPQETKKKGTKEIIQFILDLYRSPNADPLYRTKLMVVGLLTALRLSSALCHLFSFLFFLLIFLFLHFSFSFFYFLFFLSFPFFFFFFLNSISISTTSQKQKTKQKHLQQPTFVPICK